MGDRMLLMDKITKRYVHVYHRFNMVDTSLSCYTLSPILNVGDTTQVIMCNKCGESVISFVRYNPKIMTDVVELVGDMDIAPPDGYWWVTEQQKQTMDKFKIRRNIDKDRAFYRRLHNKAVIAELLTDW